MESHLGLWPTQHDFTMRTKCLQVIGIATFSPFPKAALLRSELPDVRLELRPVLDHCHHGAHLAAGAPGDGQEAEQLIVRRPLESLGDVVGNGERRAIQLVAKTSRQRHRRFFQQVQHAVVKPRGFLPYGQLLEFCVFRHVGFSLQLGLAVLFRAFSARRGPVLTRPLARVTCPN